MPTCLIPGGVYIYKNISQHCALRHSNANEIRTSTLKRRTGSVCVCGVTSARASVLKTMTPRIAVRSAEQQQFTQDQDEFAEEKFGFSEQQPIELGFSDLNYEVNDEKKSM